jgi:hypothetical protein
LRRVPTTRSPENKTTGGDTRSAAAKVADSQTSPAGSTSSTTAPSSCPSELHSRRNRPAPSVHVESRTRPPARALVRWPRRSIGAATFSSLPTTNRRFWVSAGLKVVPTHPRHDPAFSRGCSSDRPGHRNGRLHFARVHWVLLPRFRLFAFSCSPSRTTSLSTLSSSNAPALSLASSSLSS